MQKDSRLYSDDQYFIHAPKLTVSYRLGIFEGHISQYRTQCRDWGKIWLSSTGRNVRLTSTTLKAYVSKSNALDFHFAGEMLCYPQNESLASVLSFLITFSILKNKNIF